MGKKKILIVDDEVQMVQMIKLRLEAAYYDVISAGNGDEGLLKAREEKPDLILLDIMMPKKDGYSFVLEAKKDAVLRSIPVIIVTAKEGMRDLFGMEGIKDYLVKPFDDKELLGKIKAYLGESA
jgi:two-component system alkaline phosphatase synthesis response regulator PhoP